MNEQFPKPVITITPEPSPEEAATIVAAVTAALASTLPAAEAESRPTSRWARQGRIEAMREHPDEDIGRR